jgi:hypothetical protein
MNTPRNLTNHLSKLTVAAATARDHGYVHTGRALDRMIRTEKTRLRASLQILRENPPPLCHDTETS